MCMQAIREGVLGYDSNLKGRYGGCVRTNEASLGPVGPIGTKMLIIQKRDIRSRPNLYRVVRVARPTSPPNFSPLALRVTELANPWTRGHRAPKSRKSTTSGFQRTKYHNFRPAGG